MDLFNLKNKIAVITGASGVLGSAIATYLAQQGSTVVLCSRNQEELNKLAENIKKEGWNAFWYAADVTSEENLQQLYGFLKKEFGFIDALLNAAGGNMPGAVVTPEQSFTETDTNALKKVIDLNYIGTYLPTKILLPLFLEFKKGSIINISSMSAERPLTRVMGYSSAKAAIDNLTKWLAVEFAQKYGDGLRVNAIAPGFFLTYQNKELLTNADGSLTQRGKQILNNTPMGRFGQPDELFGAVHYLCSDASKFVTGTVLQVDGGFGAFSGV